MHTDFHKSVKIRVIRREEFAAAAGCVYFAASLL